MRKQPKYIQLHERTYIRANNFGVELLDNDLVRVHIPGMSKPVMFTIQGLRELFARKEEIEDELGAMIEYDRLDGVWYHQAKGNKRKTIRIPRSLRRLTANIVPDDAVHEAIIQSVMSNMIDFWNKHFAESFSEGNDPEGYFRQQSMDYFMPWVDHVSREIYTAFKRGDGDFTGIDSSGYPSELARIIFKVDPKHKSWQSIQTALRSAAGDYRMISDAFTKAEEAEKNKRKEASMRKHPKYIKVKGTVYVLEDGPNRISEHR